MRFRFTITILNDLIVSSNLQSIEELLQSKADQFSFQYLGNSYAIIKNIEKRRSVYSFDATEFLVEVDAYEFIDLKYDPIDGYIYFCKNCKTGMKLPGPRICLCGTKRPPSQEIIALHYQQLELKNEKHDFRFM